MGGRWAGIAGIVAMGWWACSAPISSEPELARTDGWTETEAALTGEGPVVTFAASATRGSAPLSIYFDGTRSRPAADGSWIVSCRLDYGDGGATPNCWGVHNYVAGTWTAVFTVTDNLGRAASAQLVIQSLGSLPIDAGVSGPSAVLTASPTDGVAPQSVYLDASSSRPAADGSWISGCHLDLGDGASVEQCWAVHTYTVGTWTAKFTATDNLGRTSIATQQLRIRASDGGAPDSGVADSGTGDAGVADGGSPDGGVADAGAADAGTADGGTSGGGWTLWGRAQGGPQNILGASADAAGNIWVAGGAEGLFLLAPGATQFRRFTVADGLTGVDDGSGLRTQSAISVAGGPAGTVFVGYEGLPGCAYAFENYNFDLAHRYLWKSGDADRVTWNGDRISVAHYDLSSGPNVVAAEPQGREKLCTIYRIAYHPQTHSVWFAGNHGVAWADAASVDSVEHTHPAINGYVAVRQPDGSTTYRYTLLSDLYYGAAPLPNGDVWLGGANRSALFRWTGLGRSFWSADTDIQRHPVDLWRDAVAADAYPDQRVDDLISDLAALPDGSVWASSIQNGLAHWTPSGIFYARDRTVEPNGKATALETDPADGSLWVGFIWGGVTRQRNGVSIPYDGHLFGSWINGRVADIQSDTFGGRRRILISFAGQAGVPAGLAVYDGP